MGMKRRRKSEPNVTRMGNTDEHILPTQGSDSSIMDLPQDIVVEILLKLSTKSIIFCKCVCKEWRNLISDAQFAKFHFQQSKPYPLVRTLDLNRISRTLYLVDPESLSKENTCSGCGRMKLGAKLKIPIRNAQFLHSYKEYAGTERKRSLSLKPKDHKYKIVNSCNGLLCLSEPLRDEPFAVCNPITGEFINLPVAEFDLRFGSCDCGLGFSPKSNQYKVIKIFNRWLPDSVSGRVVEIHTLGTDSWRILGKAPHIPYKQPFPTYLNGALHWLCKNQDCLLSFSFDKEEFGPIPLPPRHHGFRFNNMSLVSIGVLRGLLCVCDASTYDPIDVWVMESYGVKESWTLLFSICTFHDERPLLGLCQPIDFLENGALLMFHYRHNALIYYDPRKVGIKYLKFRGFKSKFEVFAHTPSLLSLKDMVMGDNLEVLNINSRCGNLKVLGETKALFLEEEFIGVV